MKLRYLGPRHSRTDRSDGWDCHSLSPPFHRHLRHVTARWGEKYAISEMMRAVFPVFSGSLLQRFQSGNPIKDGKVQRPGTAKRSWSCVRSRGTALGWLGDSGPASGTWGGGSSNTVWGGNGVMRTSARNVASPWKFSVPHTLSSEETGSWNMGLSRVQVVIKHCGAKALGSMRSSWSSSQLWMLHSWSPSVGRLKGACGFDPQVYMCFVELKIRSTTSLGYSWGVRHVRFSRYVPGVKGQAGRPQDWVCALQMMWFCWLHKAPDSPSPIVPGWAEWQKAKHLGHKRQDGVHGLLSAWTEVCKGGKLFKSMLNLNVHGRNKQNEVRPCLASAWLMLPMTCKDVSALVFPKSIHICVIVVTI